jgi:5-hydroxyisourate hydrolase
VTLTTHVLDATTGRPAAEMTVELAVRTDNTDNWVHLRSGVTDADGRLKLGDLSAAGSYRLTFGTGPWFGARGAESFYPEVAVTFEVTAPAEHYHVPLLLSPFAYSTYRGS